MKYLTSTYLKDIVKYKISIFVKEKYCITVKKILKIKGPFVLKEENNSITIIDNGYYILEYILFNENYICRVHIDKEENVIERFYTATKNNSTEIIEVQEDIVSKPKYNSENRVRRKITSEFLKTLQIIIEDEENKEKVLGTNKQVLTKKQIYELLKKQGFTASYSSVVLEMKRIKSSGNECFIRQDYNYGDRLEYDFGEVKLIINEILKKYYIVIYAY